MYVLPGREGVWLNVCWPNPHVGICSCLARVADLDSARPPASTLATHTLLCARRYKIAEIDRMECVLCTMQKSEKHNKK